MTTVRRDLTKEEIEAVWQKATIVPNNNPNVYRQDYAGAWIKRDEYGKRSEYGWEADHLIPLSQGGTYDLDNLYPLQYENNRKKSDNYPKWQTEVSAQGVHNVKNERNWYI